MECALLCNTSHGSHHATANTHISKRTPSSAESPCHVKVAARVSRPQVSVRSHRAGVREPPLERCGAAGWEQGGGGEGEAVRSRRRCGCHDMYDVLVPYVDAWRWQKACVEGKLQCLSRGEGFDDTLVVLQHPPVYTLGTRSSEANLKFDVDDPPFELHRTERGGEVTYHGPGQLVMYPILDLRHHNMDIHWYLRTLEEVVIGALDMACGIHAHRIDGLTGVWVDNQKVAAIGVRVSRWITYHGLALNATTDLAPFSNIIPCGISDYSVTSVAKLLENSRGSRQENTESLLKSLHDCLLAEFEEKFRLRLVAPCRPGPQPVSRTGVKSFL